MKRYDVGNGYFEETGPNDDTGQWVRYEDVKNVVEALSDLLEAAYDEGLEYTGWYREVEIARAALKQINGEAE